MRLVAALLFYFLVYPATAGVPDRITYSGRITDGSYDGLSAQATITFRLFDVAEGGTALWEHEETVVVQDGYFSVMLGESDDANDQPKVITAVFAEHGETWMELEVGGQVLAREAVGSVPYAVRAQEAAYLNSSGAYNYFFIFPLIPRTIADGVCPSGSEPLYSGRRFVRGLTGEDVCETNIQQLRDCAAVKFVYVETNGDIQTYEEGDKDCGEELGMVDALWPYALSGTGSQTNPNNWAIKTKIVCCEL